MAAAKFAGASPEPGGGILPAQRAGWGPGGDVACPGEEGDARGGMLVVVRAHLGKQKKRCARLVREGDACKIKIPKAGISQGPAANPKSAGCSRARPRQRPCAPRSERGRGGGGDRSLRVPGWGEPPARKAPVCQPGSFGGAVRSWKCSKYNSAEVDRSLPHRTRKPDLLSLKRAPPV